MAKEASVNEATDKNSSVWLNNNRACCGIPAGWAKRINDAIDSESLVDSAISIVPECRKGSSGIRPNDGMGCNDYPSILLQRQTRTKAIVGKVIKVSCANRK